MHLYHLLHLVLIPYQIADKAEYDVLCCVVLCCVVLCYVVLCCVEYDHACSFYMISRMPLGWSSFTCLNQSELVHAISTYVHH